MSNIDFSRYELNRQVRIVLIRYDIDVAMVDYSSIGGTVYLSGNLLKNGAGDLLPTAIEGLMREISRLSGVHNVQTDFQNWIISNEAGSWQIKKSGKKLHDIGAPIIQQGGIDEAAQEHRIETGKKIADALKDMQEKRIRGDRKNES
jgi:hypothetical protein